MKKPKSIAEHFALLPILLLLLLPLILSGCLTFFQRSPRYVEGSNIEILTDNEGDEYYAASIGKSKTTIIDAVLSDRGDYSISYTYIDSHWLLVEVLIVDTDCCLNRLNPDNPIRKDDDQGTVIETDSIRISRNLFVQILESDNPVISIKGEQGTVIVEIGKESKKNLQELLDYGETLFPGN